MDLHLSGEAAVVTGAGKGIGLAVTRALAAEGVSVPAASRTVTDDLAALGRTTDLPPLQVDLTAADGPERAVAERSPIVPHRARGPARRGRTSSPGGGGPRGRTGVGGGPGA
ncbi:SDR family NAD(P)-dependent oxidoreductase, partial [Kitasatospora sp. NPDC059973]|uniref:SDR family NAD(P)-dependent oxidoreductase n=1 Tax=Kitasatospora sp. NPDC059973 TaxID=3347020 RepID=UPI0036A7116B